MFDITAPIERQRSGSFKLLAIVDSGLDTDYPLGAWYADGRVESFTRKGTYRIELDSSVDLVTLPESLPLIVSYHNVYLGGYGALHGGTYGSLDDAKEGQISCANAIIELTFDPNTGESSAKTVWRKGESA